MFSFCLHFTPFLPLSHYLEKVFLSALNGTETDQNAINYSIVSLYLFVFFSFFYIEDILVVRILLCLLLVRLFRTHQDFFVLFTFWINSVCFVCNCMRVWNVSFFCLFDVYLLFITGLFFDVQIVINDNFTWNAKSFFSVILFFVVVCLFLFRFFCIAFLFSNVHMPFLIAIWADLEFFFGLTFSCLVWLWVCSRVHHKTNAEVWLSCINNSNPSRNLSKWWTEWQFYITRFLKLNQNPESSNF